MKKPGRNAPCPCGSDKKYKKCCVSAAPTRPAPLAAACSDIAVPFAVEAAVDDLFGADGEQHDPRDDR